MLFFNLYHVYKDKFIVYCVLLVDSKIHGRYLRGFYRTTWCHFSFWSLYCEKDKGLTKWYITNIDKGVFVWGTPFVNKTFCKQLHIYYYTFYGKGSFYQVVKYEVWVLLFCLIKSLVKTLDGCLLVYSISACQNWIQLNTLTEIQKQQSQSCPLFFFGNNFTFWQILYDKEGGQTCWTNFFTLSIKEDIKMS